MATEAIHGRSMGLPDFETAFEVAEDIWREAYWGDTRVGCETYLQDYEDTPILAGPPNDRCQCSHRGYVLSGRTAVRYADHEEVVEAGDVYHAAPDHSVAVDAGTVLIEFSPLDEWEALMAVAEENIAEMDEGGSGSSA